MLCLVIVFEDQTRKTKPLQLVIIPSKIPRLTSILGTGREVYSEGDPNSIEVKQNIARRLVTTIRV